MARAPYVPYPNATPEVQGERFDLNTPGAAFGANIGEALQHLGTTTEDVGGEMFTRAMALQDLRNQADAREAQGKFAEQASQLQGQFDSLKGKNAPDQLQAHIQAMHSLRQQFRTDLTNPISQKYYDSDSMPFMQRLIFSSAGHAGSEMRSYVTGTAEATADLTSRTVVDPYSDKEQASKNNTFERESYTMAGSNGWSEQQRQDWLTKYKSQSTLYRIDELAKRDPIAAQKLFDGSIKDGSLNGPDVVRAQGTVKQQLYTTGSRVIVQNLNTGKYWGDQPVPIDKAQAAIGNYESGGDYSRTGVQTDRGIALGKYQVMSDNLAEWLKEAGMPAMTQDEFLKNPAAQDQLFRTRFSQYMQQYGSFNEAASMWFSGKTLEQAGASKDVLGTTVPRYISGTNAELAKTMTLEDRVNAARAIAEKDSPDDPNFGEYAAQRAENDYALQKRIKTEADIQNWQTVQGAIVKGGPDGKVPTTPEELFAGNPKVEQAYDALEPSRQLQVRKALAVNAKGDYVQTEDNFRRFQQLKGMAVASPQKFLNVDVMDEKLPRQWRGQLMDMQRKVMQQGFVPPVLSRAVQQLTLQFPSALGDLKKTNPDGYNQFTGALWDELEAFQSEHKKAMTPDEVRQLGARLIQGVAGSGWFGSNVEQVPFYAQSVPKDEADAIRVDPHWKALGIEPTDDMIRSAYLHTLYQHLYGGSVTKPKQEQEPKPTETPQPPISQ